jgi:hypothetical protein
MNCNVLIKIESAILKYFFYHLIKTIESSIKWTYRCLARTRRVQKVLSLLCIRWRYIRNLISDIFYSDFWNIHNNLVLHVYMPPYIAVYERKPSPLYFPSEASSPMFILHSNFRVLSFFLSLSLYLSLSLSLSLSLCLSLSLFLFLFLSFSRLLFVYLFMPTLTFFIFVLTISRFQLSFFLTLR